VNDAGAADELGLLTTDAMRARRHPRALLGLWAWETALAALIGLPLASLAKDAFGADPRGDAVLWAPGARELLSFATRELHGLGAIATAGVGVLLLGAVAGLVPMAATMTAIAYATRDRKAAGLIRSVGEGLLQFPAMALLLLLASISQGILIAAGLAAGSIVEAWTHSGLGEARAQEIEGLVLLVFVAAVGAIGVAHDLARAAVVRFKVSGGRGLMLGARTFRLAPVALSWSWAWRSLASLAPIVAAAWAADRLGGRGGIALVALLVLHQAVVLARVSLRTSWLARALRAVDTALRRVA
jgi:hypothetical protein